MFKTKTCVTVLLATALCVPCYWVLAGDKQKPSREATDSEATRKETPRARDLPESNTKTAEPDPRTRKDDDLPTVMLGKTIKLEFKLVTPEDSPTFPVVCAIKDFAITHDISEPNHEHGVELAGTLASFDDRGRVLLTFEVTSRHSDLNEGFDATFTTKGSAVLEMGKAKALAVLGDAEFKVTATVDD